MYFHPGFAARNAIDGDRTRGAGAYASETILEGEAGLFAAFRRQPAPADIRLFAGGQPEIMAVYNKPAPGLQFRADRGQAALRVARELGDDRTTSRPFRSASRRPRPAIPAATSKGPFQQRAAGQDEHSLQRRCRARARRARRGQLRAGRRSRNPSPRRADRPAKRLRPSPRRFPPTRAPRSLLACATEKPSISASTTSSPPRRKKSAPAFGRLLPTSSATSARGIWKSWSTIAHRFRTAASSPPGAGLSRPSNGCGQHHDR